MNRDDSEPRRSPDELIPSSSDEDEWEEDEPRQFSVWMLPALLFLLTVFTVLWAGAYQTNTNPLVGPWNFLVDDPGSLWRGIPFAATLLGPSYRPTPSRGERCPVSNTQTLSCTVVGR